MSGTNSDDPYSRYAGRVLWPRSAGDIADTTLCPACLTRLPSSVCAACGLDLRHPAADRLLEESKEIAEAFERRSSIIGRIRYEVALAENARQQQQAAAVQARYDAARQARLDAERARSAPERPVIPAGATPAVMAATAAPAEQPPAATPPAVPAAAVASPPRRSSVQIVLLLVGVTLVAVAAIFFLTVAWLYAGLGFRSVLVALFTAATIVTAAILRRRRLVATAEGIGALAVVLVLLDAWALRQNNLFEFAGTDGFTYWGVALLVCAALFLPWHAVSRLRVASVAGFAAAGPGLGLLVAGLASGQVAGTRVYLAFVAAAAGTLIHRLTAPGTRGFWPAIDRRAERIALLALGGASLVAAAAAAVLVEPGSAWAPLWSLGGVGAVAVLHVIVILAANHTAPAYRAFAYGCTGLAAAAITQVALLVAIRQQSLTLLCTAPILVAAVAALALEAFARRRPPGPAHTALVVAAATAGTAAATYTVVDLAVGSGPLGQALIHGLTAAGETVARPTPESAWALAALIAVGALTTGFWWLGGVLGARVRWVAWFALAVIVIAIPFAREPRVTLAIYLVVGALALGALLLARRGRLLLGRCRAPVLALLIAAEASGYVIGWASSGTWWLASASVVLVAFFARLLVDRVGGAVGRGALLAGAIVFALIAAGVAPVELTLGWHPDAAATLINVVAGLTLATAALQAVIAVPWPRLGTVERRWAFWVLLAPTIGSFTVPVSTLFERLTAAERGTVLQPEPAATIAHCAALLIAALLWVFLRGNGSGLRLERFAAGIALAPTLLLLASTLVRATDAPSYAPSIACGAALAVCALALATRIEQTRARERIALEIGSSLILGPTVAGALLVDAPLGWLTLILAGVGALILAIAEDGLFASRSPRRHFGWLAIALAAAGLWLGLARGGTEAVEPYVLPVGGLLLVVAALIRRFGRVDRSRAESPVAALLVLAALLVAIVPVALTSEAGPLARPIIVGAVSAVLLLGASAIRPAPRRTAYLAAAGLAGAIGVLLTGAGRVGGLLSESNGPDGRLEAWLLIPGAIVVVAAFLLAAHPDAPAIRTRRTAGIVLLLIAVVGTTFAEVAAFGNSDLLAARATALVLVLSALHATGLWRRRAPLGLPVAWVSIGLAVVTMLAAVSVRATEPGELVTVPVGLALLAGQLLAARPRTGTAPSAPAGWRSAVWVLGVGIAILPSATGSTDGNVGRAVASLATSTALVLVAAGVRRFPLTASARIGTIVVAALAIVLVSIERAGRAPAGYDGPTAEFDLWLGLGAGALGAAGILANIRQSRTPTQAGGTAAPDALLAPGLLGLGLAVGLIPSTVVGAEGAVLRPILTLGMGGALAIGGALLSARARGKRLAWVAVGFGLAAIVVTGAGRITPLLTGGGVPDGRLEAWLLPAVLLLVIAGSCVDAAGRAGARLGSALVIGPVLGLLTAEVLALDYTPLAAVRVVLLVWTFSALHLLAFWHDHRPLTRLVGWIAIAAAAVAVLAGFAHSAPHPIEIVSVPLAIALLTSGALHLGATPAARSWPWFAPGLLVLLGPSLLLDVTESPLWRVVGLGVAATVVILVGTARKLQAPFVIGALVLLVHALAQLWPWISVAYGAVPWWLWLGVGGIILIVLAARYEQRIANLRSVALRISALR